MAASDLRTRTTLSVSNTRLTAGGASRRIGRGASDGELLDAYLEFVRTLRNTDGSVTLRDADLEVLGTVLGRAAEDVRVDLEQRMTAIRVARRKRVTRRAVFAAFGVGVVSSALVVLSPSGPGVAAVGAPSIGSALTIERTTEDLVVERDLGQAATHDVIIGDAQTITRLN
jgi:hypothetical protein